MNRWKCVTPSGVAGPEGACCQRYPVVVQALLIDAAARVSRSLPPLRGRGRVAQALLHRMPVMQGSWTIRMRGGHRMAVPVNSAQSWRAAFTGCYDDEEMQLLTPHVMPDSLVLDIGASLGFYTIPLGLTAQRVGARVIAIEPVRRNCDVLHRNIELNGLEEVVSVIPCALGRTPGQVSLHVESGGTGNATIVTGLPADEVTRHDQAGNTGSVELAEVRTLDDLELSEADCERPCSLMKIDAEGFEMDILAGAASFVARHRPVLFAEFNPSWLETRGLHASAPAEWATRNRYICQELAYKRAGVTSDVQHASLRPVALSGHRAGTDLMLLPAPPA